MDEYTSNQIRRVSEAMLAAGGGAPFSATERIAAGALVSNRIDWLPDRYDNIGEALVRLGAGWREAVVEVWTRNYNGRWRRDARCAPKPGSGVGRAS